MQDGSDDAPKSTALVDDMLRGLRRFAKTVMVVSCELDGRRYAMSATAVSEVSLDPPTMLICVNRDATLHIPLLAGVDFAINLLDADTKNRSRAIVAANCAGRSVLNMAIGS